MDCSYCKTKTQVKDTRKLGSDYVMRLRYCPRCRRSFTSTETYDERELTADERDTVTS